MNWRRSLLAALVTFPVIVLLFSRMEIDPRMIRSPLIGQPAPDFTLGVLKSATLRTVAGDSIRLSDHAGEVVILNFWASWCPPCLQEHPGLMATADLYRSAGVHFYGILYQDLPGNARRWLDRLGENYPTGLDPNTRTAIEWGLRSVPETYFVGRDGRIAYRHIGPISPDELVRRIDALLAAEVVVDPAAVSQESR